MKRIILLPIILPLLTASLFWNPPTPITETTKTVYLTFDDGPSAYTPKILDILSEYNVPATFFVVGSTEYKHYMKDIVEKGHGIGLHTFSHDFRNVYSSVDAYFADLKKIDDLVFEQTGIRSKVIRFPGGSSVKRNTNRAFMNKLGIEVEKRGYQYFDWHCDSRDTMGGSASGTLSRIKTDIKDANYPNDLVVLMHDSQKATPGYLPNVIKYFKDQGYNFKILTTKTPPVHHTW